MKKLKRLLIALMITLAAFAVYVEIVNRNSKNMTYRQKVLKAIYPAWMWWTKLRGKNSTKLTNDNQQPFVSFYTLKATLNNGDTFDFSTLKGKKVLLVNTASNCGYTKQYDDLQALSEKYKNELMVLGFPSNDFKQQEKGTDAEIAEFCRQNFGVTFPLMQKSVVINSENQNPVFQWLTDSSKNGWNDKQPSWNFSKYLVDENGALINFFGPSVSPLSSNLLKAVIN